MKPYEVIRILKQDGWFELPGKMTSHKHFKHPVKKGKVTVAMHPGDINPITLKDIESQSGLKLR